MNNDIEISIIVPVYNVKEYIQSCIDSILSQTYGEFELILVDDGSNDGSEIVCEEISSRDSRITVIHQKNAGLSAARNTGIQHAKGKYITFIDSDDFVSQQYVQLLYDTILSTDSDICFCDYIKVSQSSNFEIDGKDVSLFGNKYIFSNEDTIKEVYNSKYHGLEFVSWAKMYKVSLFRDNGILFPEGKLYEDAFTTYKLVYYSNSISYIDIPLYSYRMRDGSIMNSSFSLKKLDMLQATKEEYLFFQEHSEYNLMRLAFIDYLYKVKYILKIMYNNPSTYKETIVSVCNDLKNDLEESKKYIKIPLKKYLYYMALSQFPGIFLKIR